MCGKSFESTSFIERIVVATAQEDSVSSKSEWGEGELHEKCT
jgi:hypothetical protein